ncbi:MAG: response regulator [Saprospirales bacterium]|nr:MAG: response regulator [Saprospirales bacterium]
MKKILVIEDNHDVRENLEEILELSGYQVSGAKDGKDGVEMAKLIQPDLILCDIMLPILDGFGILKILSGDPALSKVPFIFLTAKSELTDMRKGMNLGADDYITKPFQKDELLSVIEMRLQKVERGPSLPPSEGRLKNLQRSEQELKKVFQDAEERRLPPNFFLFNANKRPRNVYMITEGLLKECHVSDFGKETIFRLFSVGQYPGLWEAYHGSDYAGECKTLTEVGVKAISIEEFEEIISKDSIPGLAIRELFHRQKLLLEKKLVALAIHSVRKRVGIMLEELIDHGLGSAENPIELSRADLGALCGTAKETVTRTLSDFKEEGLIEIHSGRVIVVNESSLRELPD